MKRDGAYPPPYSLRLTYEERDRLNLLSGNMPISAYIREQLFDIPSPRKRRLKKVRSDEQMLSQVLSELGRSRLSSNLNQLAKASHTGSLPLTPELEEQLLQACADIEAMKGLLIEALGLIPEQIDKAVKV